MKGRDEEKCRDALELVRFGMTRVAVARKYGVSETTIRMWIARKDMREFDYRRSARWNRAHREKGKEAERRWREKFGPEHRQKMDRARYVASEEFSSAFVDLVNRYRDNPSAQSDLAWEIRMAVLGWTDRAPEKWRFLMREACGQTKESMCANLNRDGRVKYCLDPGSVDLTAPENVCRCVHWTNIRIGRACKPLEIEITPAAIVAAKVFIAKVLRTFDRRLRGRTEDLPTENRNQDENDNPASASDVGIDGVRNEGGNASQNEKYPEQNHEDYGENSHAEVAA